MAETGYEQAIRWLDENAQGWRLLRANTRLEAGRTLGAPTEQRVEVELTGEVRDVMLRGEGATMLEAVQRAIGAWEAR